LCLTGSPNAAEFPRIIHSYCVRLASPEIRRAGCGPFLWVRLLRSSRPPAALFPGRLRPSVSPCRAELPAVCTRAERKRCKRKAAPRVFHRNNPVLCDEQPLLSFLESTHWPKALFKPVSTDAPMNSHQPAAKSLFRKTLPASPYDPISCLGFYLIPTHKLFALRILGERGKKFLPLGRSTHTPSCHSASARPFLIISKETFTLPLRRSHSFATAD
jgi:hypothetical protein